MAHHFNDEYERSLRRCVQNCEEMIDLCQQTMSICPTSVDTDCAERCAKLARSADSLLLTAKLVINYGNDHIRVCENNACINQCEKAIKDCRHVMALCTNVINHCSSNTNECTDAAKESVDLLTRAADNCQGALTFA